MEVLTSFESIVHGQEEARQYQLILGADIVRLLSL